MMKKIFYGLIVSFFIIPGCVKRDTKCPYTDSQAVAPTAEVDSLKKILQDSGVVATQHPSGFFYKINSNGAGPGVTNLCSNLTVTYKGSLFNGHVFDSTGTGKVATFQLGQVIVAWQKGVPLISKDGDMTLYIPPSLGFGPAARMDSQGNVLIPGNSYLIFNVHVVEIQ
jgi:FKBP-type peptidyl-prolyl cis-trans isomerase FkpA